MIKVGAELLYGEFIGIALSWCNRLLCDVSGAVHLIRDDQAMPVNGGCFRQVVMNVDANVIALLEMQSWSGNLLIVGIGIDRDIGKNVPTYDRGS